MSLNYAKLTQLTVSALPPEKQAAVYDFAAYLRQQNGANARKPRKAMSILKLQGIGKSKTRDLADRHNHYLYGI
jgi:hypothetical protein